MKKTTKLCVGDMVMAGEKLGMIIEAPDNCVEYKIEWYNPNNDHCLEYKIEWYNPNIIYRHTWRDTQEFRNIFLDFQLGKRHNTKIWDIRLVNW